MEDDAGGRLWIANLSYDQKLEPWMFAALVICLLASVAVGEENEKARFDCWQQLFLATFDDNFSGPKAESEEARLSIADTFARRMGLLPVEVLLQPWLRGARLRLPTVERGKTCRTCVPWAPSLARGSNAIRDSRIAARSDAGERLWTVNLSCD